MKRMLASPGAIFLFAAIVFLLAAIFAQPAGAVEIAASTGAARWSLPGTDGIYRQTGSGQPSYFDTGTRAWALGLRIGEAEVAFTDLGRATAWGRWIADGCYDEHAHKVTCRCPQSTAYSFSQRTTGVLASWAPRWTWGAVEATPAIGLLVYTVRVRGNEGTYDNSTLGVTPTASVKLAYRVGQFSLGVGSRIAIRPRAQDSVAGGGSEHPIGVRQIFTEAAIRF